MKTIFFIDDDTFVTKLYSNLLQKDGIHCTIINSGTEALVQLAENKPDLVVLDLHMPDINGVEVLRFIRSGEEMKDIPVIIFSNGYVKELVEEVGDIGAERFFTKLQCKPTQLIEEIKILLKEQETKQEMSHLEKDAAENTLQTVPISKVFLTLRKDTRPQALRICILHIYKNLYDHCELGDDHSLPQNKLGSVLRKLMIELYDNPDRVSETTINTLDHGIQKLKTLCEQAKSKLNSESELENMLHDLGD